MGIAGVPGFPGGPGMKVRLASQIQIGEDLVQFESI